MRKHERLLSCLFGSNFTEVLFLSCLCGSGQSVAQASNEVNRKTNMKTLTESAQVAKLIKTELKKHGIKASVTSENFSMGSSVDVRVCNQPPWVIKELEKFTSKFQYGHFDGMTDCYIDSNTDDSIPQTKYLSITNEYSDELRQEAWDYILSSYSGFSEAPLSHEQAGSYYSDGWHSYGSDIMYKVLSGAYMHEEFWRMKKPHITLAA